MATCALPLALVAVPKNVAAQELHRITLERWNAPDYEEAFELAQGLRGTHANGEQDGQRKQ